MNEPTHGSDLEHIWRNLIGNVDAHPPCKMISPSSLSLSYNFNIEYVVRHILNIISYFNLHALEQMRTSLPLFIHFTFFLHRMFNQMRCVRCHYIFFSLHALKRRYHIYFTTHFEILCTYGTISSKHIPAYLCLILFYFRSSNLLFLAALRFISVSHSLLYPHHYHYPAVF